MSIRERGPIAVASTQAKSGPPVLLDRKERREPSLLELKGQLHRLREQIEKIVKEEKGRVLVGAVEVQDKPNAPTICKERDGQEGESKPSAVEEEEEAHVTRAAMEAKVNETCGHLGEEVGLFSIEGNPGEEGIARPAPKMRAQCAPYERRTVRQRGRSMIAGGLVKKE